MGVKTDNPDNLQEYFYKTSTQKEFTLYFPALEYTITTDDLFSQDFSLTENLCSAKQLKFGTCEAACLKFKRIYDTQNIIGQEFVFEIAVEGHPYQMGRYKVVSDIPTQDRIYREVIAYDRMYDIIHADVTDWYKSLAYPLSLKAFRDNFFARMRIETEDIDLINDAMLVTQGVDAETLTGQTIIQAICEINGCFGDMGRDGRFRFVTLSPSAEPLVPADGLCPDDTLCPAGTDAHYISPDVYTAVSYEDFVIAKINKLQLRSEEEDIGAIVGEGTNCYVIEDNLLLLGKGAAELEAIARNLFAVISGISYRPCKIQCIGNPCITVGQTVAVPTKYAMIDTYVLQRTLTGIQALRDSLSADGTQTVPNNKKNKDIIQIRKKINTLSRTVEETRLQIEDLESGLSSQILQTAVAIATEVRRATDMEIELASRINVTAEDVLLEVSRATAAEDKISSRIKLAENSISLKVEKGTVCSSISQESDLITIKSNRFVLDSTNCAITKDGTITAQNGTFSGTIKAANGTIGGFGIGSSAIYNGKTSLTSSNSGVYVGTDGVACGGKFTVTRDGKATLADILINGSGSIDFKDAFYAMSLSAREINFGGGSITTRIDKDEVRIYQSYIDKDGLHVRSNGTTYYTDISQNKLRFGSGDPGYIYHGDNLVITLNTGRVVSIGDTYTKLGLSNGYLGFFAAAGSTKKNVAAIATTSTATVASNAIKINEIINALKGYGLIG